MFTDEAEIIIGIMWGRFLLETFITLLQYRFCKHKLRIPPKLRCCYGQETFNKARLYTLDKMTLKLVQDFFTLIISTAMIYYNYFQYTWDLASYINPYDDEISTSCIWILIYTTANSLIMLPFETFKTFFIEERHGFNKQTRKFFIVDQLMTYTMEQAFFVSIAPGVIYIVQEGGDYFFLWLWLMVGTMLMVLMYVYPAFILPLFDQYDPLPEGELKNSIKALAKEINFPLGKIYILKGSHRSEHGNAYFYGFMYGFKGIVLYDTLLGNKEKPGMTNEEILAVLSHELGHWNYCHTCKFLLITEIDLLIMCACFAFMHNYAPFYAALGFAESQKPIVIGLEVVNYFVLTPYNVLSGLVMTVLTRRYEYQADSFANEQGKGKHLISGLIKLHKHNLSLPGFDPVYCFWFHDHPSLLERIDAISEANNNNVKITSCK